MEAFVNNQNGKVATNWIKALKNVKKMKRKSFGSRASKIVKEMTKLTYS
jgi:hypothetical protein